jgi:peptidyl-prolyl cis-trans isomerase SurA
LPDCTHSIEIVKKKMKKLLMIYMLALALFLPVVARAELVSEIAAIVNDDPITTFEVDKEQADMEKAIGKNIPEDAAGKEKLHDEALNSIINKKLITQKIKELDIKVSDEEIRQAIENVKKQNNISQETLELALKNQGVSYDAYKAQIKEQLERLRLISQEVRSKIQTTEKEMRAFYAAHPEKFEKEESYHAGVITLNIPADASAEAKKKVADRASEIYTELKSGANFQDLAKKYSDDPSAKDGGDLGTFKKGEMLPEFEKILSELKPGEISEPFSTSSGLHIVKLLERFHGELKPFEKVKGEIEDSLYKKKSEERFNEWLADLRKNASVEILQK